MKKRLLAAAVAAMVSMTAGIAMAAPGDVTIDGSLQLQYGAVDRPTTHFTYKGIDSVFTLNANVNVADHLDAYARFTSQSLDDNLSGTTFQIYKNGHNNAIDAFGLKYDNAGYKYTVGSQALTIGSGLIYDNGFLGKNALPYAAVVSKKVGATDLTAFYAKTNYQANLENDKFYGLQGSYAVNDKFTVAGMFTAVKYGKDNAYVTDTTNGDSQKFYEVSGAYQIEPKLGFKAAFAKSDADKDNKAYIGTLNYKFNDKSKMGVSYYRSEDLSNINDTNWGDMTTTPNSNTKGFTVSYTDVLSKNATFNVSRSMYDAIHANAVSGDSNDRVKTQASVTFTF